MFLYDQSDRTIGESIAILTMLLGIPISLKLYHVYTREKLPSEKDEKRMIQHIVKWFLLRIGIVLVALVLNFIAYVVFGSQSAFLCVIICLVFLVFFCKPNRNDLTFLLKTDHEEKTCE
jgi:fatty acid desaturase